MHYKNGYRTEFQVIMLQAKQVYSRANIFTKSVPMRSWRHFVYHLTVQFKKQRGRSSERETAGLRSKLERESGVSGTDFVGCVWLALWPAANPEALRRLPECFAFGLAAVSRPWAAMNGLNVKKF